MVILQPRHRNILSTCILATLLYGCAAKPVIPPSTNLKPDEVVTLFPTNAYLDNQAKNWNLDIHGWVYEPEKDSLWRNGTINALKFALNVKKGSPEETRFRERTSMFLVDNERRKDIVIKVADKYYSAPPTKSNGHFKFTIRYPASSKFCDDWQTVSVYTPVHDQRVFQGNIQCVQRKGISVISDIDDTIKNSNVLDKKRLLKNIFLKKFAAVKGMVDVYRNWRAEGANFHYVSSSPWQLYPALQDFLRYSGFPDGSMHLKLFRLKDSSFFNLFDSPTEGKLPVIRRLLKTYPHRQFILVGDSGEKDPEIYAAVARSFPDQIKHIYIHDINQSRERLRNVFKDLKPSKWLVFDDA